MRELDGLLLDGMLIELKAQLFYAESQRRAEEEGYLNVSRIFRALSDAERIHLVTLARLYYKREITKEDIENLKGKLNYKSGTTEENLMVCADVEDETRQYRNAMEEALKASNPGAYIVFDQLAQVGESHGKACREALQHVKRGEDIQAEEIYVCPVCGYIHIGEPPYRCPVCGEPRKNFMKY